MTTTTQHDAPGAAPTLRRRQIAWRTVVGLVVTGSLVLFLLRFVDWHHVRDIVAQMSWPMCSLGLLLYFSIYVVRSIRFLYIAPGAPLLTMLWITSVHNFLLRVMPLRTGELAYGILANKTGVAGLGQSLVSLVLLRVLDSTMVVVLFGITLALNRGLYAGNVLIGVGISAGLALCGLMVVLLFNPLLGFGLTVLGAIARAMRLDRKPRVNRILSRLRGAVDSHASLPRRIVLPAGGYTVIQWLLSFGVMWVMMRAFSIEVTLTQVLLGGTASVVSGFLPISGIGTFGTLEAGWALGFALVGVDRTTAVASGFAYSIVTFGFAALLGLVGWIGLSLLGRGEGSAQRTT